MLKKLIRLNASDYAVAAAVAAVPFLITQVVTALVMVLVKGDWQDFEGLSLSGSILPITCGFFTVITSLSNVGLTFELSVKFGCTRRRALAHVAGMLATQAALAFGLAAPLIVLEQKALPHLWAAVRGVPGPLPTEVISLPLWLLPLIAAGCLIAGMFFGALIQRFGHKGSWVLFGIYMACLIVPQVLPDGLWDSPYTMLLPALLITAAAVLLAGFAWSIWSLLHASVRG